MTHKLIHSLFLTLSIIVAGCGSTKTATHYEIRQENIAVPPVHAQLSGEERVNPVQAQEGEAVSIETITTFSASSGDGKSTPRVEVHGRKSSKEPTKWDLDVKVEQPPIKDKDTTAIKTEVSEEPGILEKTGWMVQGVIVFCILAAIAGVVAWVRRGMHP